MRGEPRYKTPDIKSDKYHPFTWKAITDIPGVAVGHSTIVAGEGPLVVGRGPVRTGVTVILPHEGNVWTEAVFAAPHRLNGNGEMTGLEWIRESGFLTTPICLTNTHSVGVVHDEMIRWSLDNVPAAPPWSLDPRARDKPN